VIVGNLNSIRLLRGRIEGWWKRFFGGVAVSVFGHRFSFPKSRRD